MKPFLELVAEDLVQKFGDDIGEIAIVFNNKRPFEYLKRYLGALYDQPIWSPSFFTIQEFFAKTTQRNIADFYTSYFILLDSYNAQLQTEGESLISESDFLPLGETILRDFNQIDYELGNPEDIFYYLKDVAEIETSFDYLTAEQKTFLNAFWTSVSTGQHSTIQEQFVKLWKRLPNLYRSFQKRIDEANLISTAGAYRNFTEQGAETDFVQGFKQIVFIGFNALSASEGKAFRRLQDMGKALFYFDGDAYYVAQEYQEAGRFLRQNLKKWGLKNSLGDFPNLINQGKKTAIVYGTQGKVAQAKLLDQIFKTEAIDPQETAVILADESLLIPVLQSSTVSKLNVTMGFPLKETALSSFVLNWLNLQEALQETGSVQNVQVASFVDKFYQHPYSRMILGESAEPSFTGRTAYEQHYLQLNRTGAALLKQLIHLLDLSLDLMLGIERVSAVEVQLNKRLTEVLMELNTSVALTRRDNMSSQIMLAFIRKVLPSISTPLEGKSSEGMQIMGMLESRCLDFKHVIVLGASEGQLPQVSLSPSLIPDSIRRSFGLPVLENQDALSAYLFYRLWQRSSHIISVFNAQVGEGSGECTRFIKQLDFESPIAIQYRNQAQKILPPDLGAAPVIEKTPEIMAVLHRYLGADNTRFFSASALNLYLECPLQFFFKYIAGIQPPEETFDVLHPITIGRVLHGVMEDLYIPFQQSNALIAKSDITQILQGNILQQCLEKLQSEYDTTNLSSKSAMYIAAEIIEAQVRQILQHDQNLAPLRILELENKKDYKIRFPFEVEGVQYQANLATIIDRVDSLGERKRIIDYKTGQDELVINASVLGKSGQENPPKATFQALYYTLIYETLMQEEGVEPHLYILRTMQDQGTSIFEARRKSDPNSLEALKSLFKERLADLLAEIYDPSVPFTHNGASKSCKNRDYAVFCTPGTSLDTEED